MGTTARVVLGVLLALALVAAFYSMRASVGGVVFFSALSLIISISLATREIVAAISGTRRCDAGPNVHRTQRLASVPMQTASASSAMSALNSQGPVLGQRPGESLEAWARRVEQAEIAAFKSRGGI